MWVAWLHYGINAVKLLRCGMLECQLGPLWWCSRQSGCLRARVRIQPSAIFMKNIYFKSTVEKSSIQRQCIAHLKEKTKNANLSALALTLTSVHNFEQMKIFRGENMTRFDMTRFGISDTTSNGDVLFSYIK